MRTKVQGFLGQLWLRGLAVETSFYEAVSATLCLAWALVLFFPYEVLQAFTSFDVLRAVMTETQWGLVALACGLVQGAGVVSSKRYLRRAGTLASAFFWGSVGTTIFMATPHATGGPVYLIYAFYNSVAYIFLNPKFQRGRA